MVNTMVPQKLFRAKHVDCTDLYLAEQAGSWGRWDSKKEALQKPKEWWEANVTPHAMNYILLEEVK
jgi:hypothetical protein